MSSTAAAIYFTLQDGFTLNILLIINCVISATTGIFTSCIIFVEKEIIVGIILCTEIDVGEAALDLFITIYYFNTERNGSSAHCPNYLDYC